MPGSIGEYRVVETVEALVSGNGHRGSMALFATPVLMWVRAVTSRVRRRRKSDPDVVEGHRVIGLK